MKLLNPNLNGSSQGIEDLYIDLYGKIGRDYVGYQEFVSCINAIISYLDPTGTKIGIDLFSRNITRSIGLEYKKMREEGRLTAETFKDLVDMTE